MEELIAQATEILNRLVKEFDKSGEACAYRDSKAQETQEEVYKLEHYPADYTEEQAAKIYEAHEEAMEILYAALEIDAAFAKAAARTREAIRAIKKLKDMGL